MALAAVTTAAERPAIVTQVSRDGAPMAWQLVLECPSGDPTSRRARSLDVDALVTDTERQGSRFVIPVDPEWPAPLELHQSVAVIGARAATGYGIHLSGELGHGLTGAGHTTVASLAYGCDIAALRGALVASQEHGCPHPVVVMASGYSRSVRLQGQERLVEAMAADATVVSEHPTTAPLTRAGTIGRARLLPGLSSAVVLVEAAERSGALLTMDAAE